MQVAGPVIIVGFFVLVLLAYLTYKSDPPIPDRVVDPRGRIAFTGRVSGAPNSKRTEPLLPQPGGL
ncbi:MAG: hypothetical protein ACM31K_05385 [Solirubrobacterales bacterium]